MYELKGLQTIQERLTSDFTKYRWRYLIVKKTRLCLSFFHSFLPNFPQRCYITANTSNIKCARSRIFGALLVGEIVVSAMFCSWIIVWCSYAFTCPTPINFEMLFICHFWTKILVVLNTFRIFFRALSV